MVAPASVILGLGREVGEATARRLLEAGQNVLAVDTSQERVDKVEERLPKATVKHQNTLDKVGIRNALKQATQEFGRVDNLIVIPPLLAPDALDDVDLDKIGERVGKAVSHAIKGIWLFADWIRSNQDDFEQTDGRSRQRGSVTFILSQTAELPQIGKFTQSVTQGAILAAIRAGAMELAGDKIRVNAISAIRPRSEGHQWIKERAPLARAALADEVAEAVAYLTAENAAIVTGHTLVLDGGHAVFGGRYEAPPGNGNGNGHTETD